MALLDKNKTETATSKFEDEDNATATEGASTEGASTEVATSAQKAEVAVASPGKGITLRGKPLKADCLDHLHQKTVDYNTFDQVIVGKMGMKFREEGTDLGQSLTFELISFHNTFVLSPNNDLAPKELVRYSEDGVTCSDGTSVAAHLEQMKLDYPKASLKPRTTVVGLLLSCEKTPGLEDTPIQFDLSSTSAGLWKRYMSTAGIQVSLGKFTEEQVRKVRATVVSATNADKDEYLKINFSTAV